MVRAASAFWHASLVYAGCIQGLSAFGANFLNSFQAIGWHTRAAPAKP